MVEFRGVSKVYANGTEALNNVNLKVDKGEFVFIVGSSGAGKSTFLKLIMCEERPNEGDVLINGTNVSRIKKRKIPFIRRKMGIVFQDFRLIDHMNVYDNVAFAMRVVGASRRSIKKRVPYILSLVGLQNKAKNLPTELSGGERQRVGLARALVNNPTMIVADEPTGNIDPALSFEIIDLLNEINRRGTTILMVTHEHSLVKHFHKRIIQIHSGQVVADTAKVDDSEVSVEDARRALMEEELESEIVFDETLNVVQDEILEQNEEIYEENTAEEIVANAVIDTVVEPVVETAEETVVEETLNDEDTVFYDEFQGMILEDQELTDEEYEAFDSEEFSQNFLIEDGEEDRG